jgi:CRP-like cAMP-binding protein
VQGPSALSPLVRKLERWQELDAADREALLALPHVVQKVEAGRYIVREGDRPGHACLLVSGFAFRQKLTGDGARSISAVHMAGDPVDLQNSLLGTADHSVQTLTQAEVAFIPRQAILDIAFAFPRVGIAMWQNTLVDGSISREWIANVSRRDAPTRIAHLLCEFALRLEDAGLGDRFSYELPMTQEQLADATGLTSVHVNRTLKLLESEGLISRTIRAVAIADWARLERAADFNSTYLHLRDDESLLP